MTMNQLITYLLIITSVLVTVHSQDSSNYACSTNYCSAYGNCPKFHCKGKNEITLRNSTDCGCCHRCIKELDENEECISEMTFNTPDTQCGPHLMCNKITDQKDPKYGKSLCKKISDIYRDGCERKAYERSLRPSEMTTGEPIPECDDLGYYSSVQCKNGTLCYCVDRDGQKIFGSDSYDKKEDMNCLCSRQFAQVNSQLSKMNYTLDPVNFMRCKPNGNYQAFQVNGNYTYCVNTTSGQLSNNAMPVLRRYYDQLPCKNDRNYVMDEKSKCIQRHLNVTKEMEKKADDGYMVVGYDVPQCDLDGTFAPVQCLNKYCYCVNKNGEKYRDTEVDRTDPVLAVNQTCSCVRELEQIRTIPSKKWDKVTELFSLYICDLNGNYLPLQCPQSEAVCYCVDTKTGYQTSNSVLKTDLQMMAEYKSVVKWLPCMKVTKTAKRIKNKYPNILIYKEHNF